MSAALRSCVGVALIIVVKVWTDLECGSSWRRISQHRLVGLQIFRAVVDHGGSRCWSITGCRRNVVAPIRYFSMTETGDPLTSTLCRVRRLDRKSTRLN